MCENKAIKTSRLRVFNEFVVLILFKFCFNFFTLLFSNEEYGKGYSGLKYTYNLNITQIDLNQ